MTMTVANTKTLDTAGDWMPVAQTGGGFARYFSMFCEVLAEALQQTQDARRKYPFADV
jgi:hypothetical protein